MAGRQRIAPDNRLANGAPRAQGEMRGNSPALREIPGTAASIPEVTREDSTFQASTSWHRRCPCVGYAVP